MPPVPTVSATVALPTRPPESLTEAMIRCVPGESVLVVKERPVPMTPSRLETHERLAEMSPASSIAVPVKVRLEPTGTCTPDAGAAMVTCGALLLFVEPGVMVTMTKAEPVRPLESATCAVITCVPSEPATLDDHLIAAERSPSLKSTAVPLRVTDPEVEKPSAGETTVRTGGAA